MKLQDHIDEINQIGAGSWLIVKGAFCKHDALSRDPDGSPLCVATDSPPSTMRRFMLQIDGGTSFDAEILRGGKVLRVLWNGHFRLRWIEDAAFAQPAFISGSRVTWAMIKRHAERFVALSNIRGRPEGVEKAIWNAPAMAHGLIHS